MLLYEKISTKILYEKDKVIKRNGFGMGGSSEEHDVITYIIISYDLIINPRLITISPFSVVSYPSKPHTVHHFKLPRLDYSCQLQQPAD